MSQVKTLIESIASGKNAEAKELFESAISERAYEYLQEYKKTLAESMFSEKKEEEDEDEEEDDDEDEKEDDDEDENSKGTMKK